MFPEVTRLLTSHTGNTSNSEDILSSACYTVRNLMTSQPQMAKQYFSNSMLNNVFNLCRNRWTDGQRRDPLPLPTQELPGSRECAQGRQGQPEEDILEADAEGLLLQTPMEGTE